MRHTAKAERLAGQETWLPPPVGKVRPCLDGWIRSRAEFLLRTVAYCSISFVFGNNCPTID
jgi:hypothetical protein